MKESYTVGETVLAMCTSWQSHPPANLSWFINAEPAREEYLQKYELRKEFDLTFTSVLGLEFVAHTQHFRDKGGKGKASMVLRCNASLFSVYWQSSEVRIRQEVSFYGQISPPLPKNDAAAANRRGSNHMRHQRRRKGSETSSPPPSSSGPSASTVTAKMATIVICLSTTAILLR